MRTDVFIGNAMHELSRSQLAQRNAEFFINDKKVKGSRTVHPGECLTVVYDAPSPSALEPHPMDIEVIYEDDQVIVINKDPGVVVHPGAGNFSGTLVQGVLHLCSDMLGSFPEDVLRPGIVHRLDKDTSGTIIFAKNSTAHEYLARQFHDRQVKKTYIALIRGVPKQLQGTVTARIARDRLKRKVFRVVGPESSRGRNAVTRYRVLRTFGHFSLVSLEPVTGRTHQLRVHMKHIGCPIIGDPIYGSASGPEPGLMLHAFSLQIHVPGKGMQVFRSPMPSRVKEFIRSTAV